MRICTRVCIWRKFGLESCSAFRVRPWSTAPLNLYFVDYIRILHIFKRAFKTRHSHLCDIILGIFLHILSVHLILVRITPKLLLIFLLRHIFQSKAKSMHTGLPLSIFVPIFLLLICYQNRWNKIFCSRFTIIVWLNFLYPLYFKVCILISCHKSAVMSLNCACSVA